MKKKKIYYCCNNFYKEIELIYDLSENYGIYLGNQNSYGDCFIPHSHFSYKDKKREKLLGELGLDPSVTIEEYIYRNKKLLFGIPGKGNVTIGGAIAADTHGKDNIWGGSFSKNIDSLKQKQRCIFLLLNLFFFFFFLIFPVVRKQLVLLKKVLKQVFLKNFI